MTCCNLKPNLTENMTITYIRPPLSCRIRTGFVKDLEPEDFFLPEVFDSMQSCRNRSRRNWAVGFHGKRSMRSDLRENSFEKSCVHRNRLNMTSYSSILPIPVEILPYESKEA